MPEEKTIEEQAAELKDLEVREALPPPTIEELHLFLLKVREAAYISALQTAVLIDEWMEKYPLPPPAEEDQFVAEAV